MIRIANLAAHAMRTRYPPIKTGRLNTDTIRENFDVGTDLWMVNRTLFKTGEGGWGGHARFDICDVQEAAVATQTLREG